jgi:xanthine dehydrogenase accessory factor
MRADLFEKAADLARRGEPFVLAFVVHREAPSSAQLGDMAVVTAAGEYHGWVGGACTRPTVEREARSVLAEGRPRTIVLAPDPAARAAAEQRPGVAVFPMTCHSGGSVEIVLEPVLPAPRLVLFGASPTARALAALGRTMGYAVVETAAGDPPPPAATAAPGAGAAPARPPLLAVVAAAGEGDEEAIRAALALAPDYLGVVASSRRFAQIRETLQAGGAAAAALDRISSPAGLDIGARTPEEIALSVLAEIVQRRRETERAGSGESVSHLQVEPPAPSQAIDPICGMTVDVARARHTAEHAGRAYYFCCAGCRERFLAAPERYLAGGAA